MLDLAGQSFGRLKVIDRNENDYITPSTGKRTARWNCQCACGNITVVTSSQLRCGKTQSCGCLQKERTARANTKHGGRYDRLHNIWANMKNRCFNPNYAEYNCYGGRGITVCDEWLEYPTFKEWAIAQGYNDKLDRGIQTLDRIDINKGYQPDNCRFVDMFVQANNKQNTIKVPYKGEEHTLSEWAEILGLTYNYLYYRIQMKGLLLEEII